MLATNRLNSVFATLLPSKRSEDWKAYYLSFCDAHGQFPMLDGARLIFPDGWTYSSSGYAGQEWPPPEDGAERAALIRTYWVLRQELAKKEFLAVSEHLRQMEIVQSSRSCPIMYEVERRDEAGKKVKMTEALNLDSIREQLVAIREDLELCNENLM